MARDTAYIGVGAEQANQVASLVFLQHDPRKEWTENVIAPRNGNTISKGWRVVIDPCQRSNRPGSYFGSCTDCQPSLPYLLRGGHRVLVPAETIPQLAWIGRRQPDLLVQPARGCGILDRLCEQH